MTDGDNAGDSGAGLTADAGASAGADVGIGAGAGTAQPWREQDVTAHRLDRAALRYWQLVSGLWAGGLGVVVAVLTAWLWRPTHGWVLPGTAILEAALLCYAVAAPRIRYAVHRWALTEAEVITEFGWFVRNRRIAPLSRVQTVDSAHGPLLRRFGLADVVVTTASSAGAVRIPALRQDTATRLEASIRQRIEQLGNDGT